LNIVLNPKTIVSELSVAEKQVVKIAKALAKNAKIIIMDEPTASLNQNEIKHLLQLVKEIRNKGIGIIYISHRLKEVFEVADRITVLRDGKKINTHNIGEVTENDLISEMVGRKGDIFYKRENVKVGQDILKVSDFALTRDSGKISFSVKSREIFGIAGMVGSGRSELVKGIVGIGSAIKGKVFFNNREISIKNPSDAVRNGICLVPEDRQTEGLILSRSVRENITLAGLNRFKGFFVKRITEISFVKDLISKLNIKTPSAEQIVSNLSGGNQQKVVLSKWLFANAEVLIFDEPTRGIDIGAKQEIYKLMGEMLKQDKTIIMISSDMPEIISLCDRVMVLRNNELAGILNKDEISETNILKLAIG
jgi:ribose transport system ATP-binding protein